SPHALHSISLLNLLDMNGMKKGNEKGTRSLPSVQNEHFSSFNAKSAISKECNRLWVSFTFLFKHARGQRIMSIRFQNGNRPLKNDRPVVIHVVSEVHRTAADRDPARQNRFMNLVAVKSLAAESRDECGVNVHDAAAKVFRNSDELQKPR